MSTQRTGDRRRVTVRSLLEMKQRGDRIVALTAYDYLFARLVDDADVDLILVGDSVGQVFAGYDSTLPVTLDDMIYHPRRASRGAARAARRRHAVHVVPGLCAGNAAQRRPASQGDRRRGRQARGRRRNAAEHVLTLVRAGIPVLGHIGLTPQSVHALGGYRVQGRDAVAAERLREEAGRLEAAGAFGIVLELLPAAVAATITKLLVVPTIGIGAGSDVDGQILVLHDALGLNEEFQPKFLRRFAELGQAARDGLQAYARPSAPATTPVRTSPSSDRRQRHRGTASHPR
jgi:3-methyl-2-oxobutanoate hydroxymethyltransferase